MDKKEKEGAPSKGDTKKEEIAPKKEESVDAKRNRPKSENGEGGIVDVLLWVGVLVCISAILWFYFVEPSYFAEIPQHRNRNTSR
jgi:hypothetical protein